MLDTLAQDLRYALRTLARSPGFAVPALATLALGIGANTAIFSVVNGVLLRPSPFADAGRLMMVWETDRKSGTTREPSSIPDYLDFRERSRAFAQLAGFIPAELNISPEQGDPFRLAALETSGGFFPMAGIAPIVGRTFSADEDRPGGPRVALIGEDLWRRLYGRDPGVVGRTIRVNDVPHQIVGVLGADADFGTLQVLGAAAYGRAFAERGGRTRVDLWIPLRPDPVSYPRDTHPLFVLGRLAPGASPASAQREMGAVAADLERAYPSNDARGVFVEPLTQVVFASTRTALLVLLGAVTLVLLIACANVANLLLARGASRAREVTVRTALGATTLRLARQFLVESAVLTLAGAVLGVLMAIWGLDMLLRLAPASIPRVTEVGLDARTLAVTLAVSVLVTAAFGLLPTLQARGADLQAALQGHAARAASASRAQHRVRSGLVVAEVALAVTLMAGAGLLIRSLWLLWRVEPGFQVRGVLKLEYQLPSSRYPQDYAVWPRWREIQRFDDELRRRAAALPGVAGATVVGNHPLDAGFTSSIQVVGREAEAADWPEPAIRRVDAGYLPTLSVPLVAGRAFAASDAADAAPVAIVNEAARRRFFAGREPLGQRIRLWGAARTVVGVVGDERFHGLAEATPPAVYLPLPQAPGPGHSLLVRVRGDPAALAPALRGVVRALDPALPVFGVEPLERTVSDSMGQRRFTMVVLGLFAGVALLLALVGVHGVLSYAVAQRTREIGIRLALGADAREVRALVVGQGAMLAAVGLALGLAAALALTRLLRSLLYGVGTGDPATFAGVALALAAAALLASWLPARRAALVDPITALRNE